MLPTRVFILGVVALASFSVHASDRSALAEPSLSPDKSQVVFVSGADIWTAPSRGGEARRLVSHPAAESRPLFSPDGTELAFVSNRTGNGDIYVLTLSTGGLRRITFDDWRTSLARGRRTATTCTSPR